MQTLCIDGRQCLAAHKMLAAKSPSLNAAIAQRTAAARGDIEPSLNAAAYPPSFARLKALKY